MSVYYIDPALGLDENDGLSQGSPKKDYRKIKVLPGDSVLFKCGTFIRDRLYNAFGELNSPIIYGSYGEGQKPTFCGSVDILQDENAWTDEGGNIWSSDKFNDELCNLIFDGGKSCGTLRWEKEELCEQGDFFDNYFGYVNNGKKLGDDHKVYLYSVKNPAHFYSSIEAAGYGHRILALSGRGLVFDGLRFINSGAHGIAAGVDNRNLTVRNCDFEFIGGLVWNKDLKIRFGNAFECWNVAEDVLIENCRFYEIYDSATTHQGAKNECKPAKNFIVRNCYFEKCGMAAYEQRDLLPLYAEFIGNVCKDAGDGFSKQGETMPRRSEIYPQPMGHHIFLWRITSPTEGGKMVVRDNIFDGAPYGASIYSIISTDAEAQIELSSNRYLTASSDELVNRYGEKDFKSLDEYIEAGFEKDVKKA